MDTIKELEEKQFIKDCPHVNLVIEDSFPSYGTRKIVFRCSRCGLDLLGYVIEDNKSYLSYVRACVDACHGNRKIEEE